MRGDNRKDPVNGYPAWIEVETFVDEMLLQEFTKNVDAYEYSSFFHKDRSGKLRAGPVWDFDQSFGNSVKWRGDLAGGWMFTRHNLFWKDLFNDDAFQRMLRQRWIGLRGESFQTHAILEWVDETADRLREAQRRNFVRWPIIGEWLWREPPALIGIASYQQEVDHMKQWIHERLNWMDRRFGYED